MTAASLAIQAAITRKRAGLRLSAATIRQLIGDFVAGHTPDYQMAAWLATVACRGLDLAETVALTRAYVHSGETLTFDRPVVDKHSTGGVGDTVTLVVVPVVAACGVPVLKLSGRGLGFAGGTIDKLESIPGLRLDLGPDELREVLDRVGMVIAGHSAAMVPGDGLTYALRDVTATVECVPLIAASIMSKKIASGTRGVVLDVKYGDGALIPDPLLARELADLMVDIGAEFDLPCRVVLSDMGVPLGRAVGNALEVAEALAALGGEHVPGLTPLCETIAAQMIQIGSPGTGDDVALARARAAIASGAALDLFRRWVAIQGGTLDAVPHAENVDIVAAPRDGRVAAIRARAVGEAALHAGAGRLRHGDRIDPTAGVLVRVSVGDRVAAGDTLAELHWSGAGAGIATAAARLAEAFELDDAVTAVPPGAGAPAAVGPPAAERGGAP